MTYRVVWRRAVVSLLETLVFTAFETGDDAREVTAAVDGIQRLLATEPLTAGERLEDGERLLIVAPFTVTYETFVADRVVLIYTVQYHDVG